MRIVKCIGVLWKMAGFNKTPLKDTNNSKQVNLKNMDQLTHVRPVDIISI